MVSLEASNTTEHSAHAFYGAVTVTALDWLTEDVFRLTVAYPGMPDEAEAKAKTTVPQSCSQVLQVPKPGQFFMVETGAGVLKRPLSISAVEADHLEFTVRITGKGTRALSTLRPGEGIEIMGPLGNGFDVHPYERVLIVGGGIGVAPLKPLVREYGGAADVILGYRTAVFEASAFQREGRRCTVCVESPVDAANTYVTGNIADPFLKAIEGEGYDMIFACGPEGMLKWIAAQCNVRSLPVQLLMERRMACGIGACLVCTCAVRRAQSDSDAGTPFQSAEASIRRVRMCKEGPMFYGSEVVFDV